MAEPTCHYCDNPARAECPTCGRLYCEEHGDDVCLRCMAPESASPGAWAYRGSVLALAIATLVVLFLIIRPPASAGQDTVRTVATNAPLIGATATPTPKNAATPTRAPGGSPVATASPSASAAASPSPGATQGPATYTVKSGDTMSGIAAQFNTTVAALLAANPGVSADSLQIGTVLKIPQ